MRQNERTPAQNRGDVQAGAAGDKTPGFDPAVAPQETDAEAGGVASQASDGVRGKPEFRNEASFANAMRPMENEPRLQPRQTWPVMVIALVVIVAAAIFVIAAILR